MKKLAIAVTFALAPFAAQADDFLYILSAKVHLLSEPSFESVQVENITKGEKVVQIDKNNNWFKVEYNGKQGWLSRLSVSPHPPTKKTSRLAQADESLVNDSRRRASVASTTAAVRGLKGDGRERLSASIATDYDALAEIERVTVRDQEVNNFMGELPNS